MTVNELIEVLEESGDKKWRDAAEIKVVNDNNDPDCWWGDISVDRFNVKVGVKSVDIHI